ncbi:MAG: crotonase [Firmicutes bacterium]|nr:enoyl-CoA hydratase-related protein [Bacillota bacterium]NLO66317.1 crotonase [Bacillota bacterium]
MDLTRFELTPNGKWALLELARPAELNVLDETALAELDLILDKLEAERIKVVVITGQGRAFAAGADVSTMAQYDAKTAEEFSRFGNGVFQKIEDHPAIFIAAVNGFTLGGGCELALACDFRFASTKASFGQPEINLGIIPGFGGTQRLPRIIGPAKAKEWILTGRRYSAEEAHEVGLVSRVVEPDHLLAETKAFAEELVTKSGPILALAKRAINSSVGMGGEDIPLEANLFGQCFATRDGPEGLKAFLEKRSPNFEDR